MCRRRLAETSSEASGSATQYPVTWPVEFEAGGTGITRGLSAQGARIETNRELGRGVVIRFSVRVPRRPEGPTRLVCEGTVVEVEPLGSRWAIAVVFDSVRFEW